MKINGMTSTLATKGNEKEIGRKLEPETRSAGEYFHIKKHCFQKNDTNITGRGSTEFISAALASITTAEMEDSQSSEITLSAARALPARPHPRPRAHARVGPPVPVPGPPPVPHPGPREAGQPGPGPLVAISAPGKRVSRAPAPAPALSLGPGPGPRPPSGTLSPAPSLAPPHPHPGPHPGPGEPGQPGPRRTWPSSRARPLEGAMLSWKTWACFSLSERKLGTRHND